jgi:hypothetical protein
LVLDSPKRKRPGSTPAFSHTIMIGVSGAGDGIRTHDPNLGKVMLYP